MSRYSELIELCEGDIRAGRAQNVAKRLASLPLGKIPREFRLGLAVVCRRASLFGLGLRVLAPLVQAKSASRVLDPSSQELAEYGILLHRCGSTQEALLTLAKVDTLAVPEANLYRAFCHFGRWETEQAIPFLRAYIDSGVTDYWKLVGRVNLAASLLITDQVQEAGELLEMNVAQARAEGATRLEGNCLELRAQLHLKTGRFQEARRDLDASFAALGGESTVDQFFVRKWQAVLAGLAAKETAGLTAFRAEAETRSDWENVREADLYLLKVAPGDRARFDHLYFGTPYGSYRERIVRETGMKPMSGTYLFGSGDGRTLDLFTGEIGGGIGQVKPGLKIHHLFGVLMRDFYRPCSLGGLFAGLFPSDHFDVFSSPNRTHQIIDRARKWIERSKLPLSIHESDGAYRIRIEGEFGFRVSIETGNPDSHGVHLIRLKRRFRVGVEFSMTEGAKALEMSSSSFKRFLQGAVERGELVRIGKSSATRYRFREERIVERAKAA